MFDIISIGDSTIDHIAALEDVTVNCTLNKDNCLFCMNYADKIPITQLNHEVAGNAANNAVGSSRLGLNTAIWSIVGDDDGGNMIYQKLLDEKVTAQYLDIVDGTGTNYSMVLSFQGERTILIYHEKRDYSMPRLEKSSWIYLTSMGEGWEKIIPPLLNYLKREGAKLAFNPGTYQMKSGIDVLRALFAVCDVLFVNKQEAERLVNQSKRGDMAFLMMALKKEGPSIVVITDGKNGSCFYDGANAYHMDVCQAPVVEMTGAGDSYATGFVGALHYGLSVTEAVRWGTVNAASVIGKIGPQAGLLTRDEVEEWLKTKCSHEPQKM